MSSNYTDHEFFIYASSKNVLTLRVLKVSFHWFLWRGPRELY